MILLLRYPVCNYKVLVLFEAHSWTVYSVIRDRILGKLSFNT